MSKKTKTAKTPKTKAKSPKVAPEAKTEATDATVANADATTAPEGATPEGKPARKTKAPKEPKAKKVSGLDLVAQVLKDKGEPMPAKAIAEAVIAAGWQTKGKTPAATLYSAMLREIDGKPGESRFTKTGRGLFALTGKN